MYNYKQVKTIHLEITSRCQASCPMCLRNIQGGLENPWLEIGEITLEDFKEWLPVEFIRQLDRLYMCGNTGDPIVAKDTLEIFKYLRKINPTIQLSMNTNGSAKSLSWWKELADTDVEVRVGIDGLADTHHLYRIGTDWQKIIDNLAHFISEGGRAIWDMLIFDHNKHQVESCRKLSQEMGFKTFYAKDTSRFKENFFPVLTKEGTTSHVLFPSTRSNEFTKKFKEYKIEENKVIHCKVKNDLSMFINAHGEVSPCCWLDFASNPPMGFAYVDYKDHGFKNYNLKNHTLAEIFDSGYFEKIEKLWGIDPLRQCSKQCGKIDKFKEQFNDS